MKLELIDAFYTTKNKEKRIAKTSHQSGNRTLLSLMRNAKHPEEMCLQHSPHLREQWLANFSQLFVRSFCSRFAKKVGGSKNIPEKVQDNC